MAPAVALASAVAVVAMPAPAAASYLFWNPPSFAGGPAKGDEPGIGLAMPGATTAELDAHLLWNMRAGLNVAALQCQFSPSLQTVRNYNWVLKQHGPELTAAYTAIQKYYKRTQPKGWQVALDQYTTKTYNGFSTLHAQLGFCETAATIGRDALDRPRGSLHLTAENRMREFRNSLVPLSDGLRVYRWGQPVPLATLPSLDRSCWDGKGQLKPRCQTTLAAAG